MIYIVMRYGAWKDLTQIYDALKLCDCKLLFHHDVIRCMHPQMQHWVVTVKPSICKDGHFYCISTLSKIIIVLYHTWALGGLITNTNHVPSQLLLIHIIYLWHQHFVLKEKVTSRHCVMCFSLQIQSNVLFLWAIY